MRISKRLLLQIKQQAKRTKDLPSLIQAEAQNRITYSEHIPSVHRKVRLLGFCFLLFIIAIMSGCNSRNRTKPIVVEEQSETEHTENSSAPAEQPVTPAGTANSIASEEVIADVFSFIVKDGTTLETRINPPADFERIQSETGEITAFLRSLPLKADQSEVLLYDGLPKGNQNAHVAIFSLDTGDKDLQQCADSVIRIYAEYYWSIGAYDKIAFHLTNGFLMEYTKWRDGNRLVVDGNDVRWSKTEAYNDSYEAFRDYLQMVYVYAGTLSLSSESDALTLDQLKPGDMFLEGGSPGHCVLVVDIAEDKDNNRCFLLAQGYMPAQDFHIIKNPLHPEDPWYYASEINYPLETPMWTFHSGSLVRWSDFVLTGISASALSEGNGASVSSNIGSNGAEEGSSQVTLLAAGDNLIHIQVVKSGLKADGTLNYDHLYSNLKNEISAADIAIVNQETILGGDQFAYSGYPDFNSPTEIGDALVDAGFDVITHATNHTMDKGIKGLQHTFDFWAQYPQIKVLGINESKKKRDEITVIEKNGIKLAFLNYTYGLNGHTVPDEKPYLVNMLNKKKMAEDIKKAEEFADFTIVLPHWGTEYQYDASKDQQYYTSFFYEAGVDLVIGTHPHVLEPVEWVGEEDGHRMLVYYSLGNFVSYQKEAPRMLGGIASVTITKNSDSVYISDAGITPIITHYENSAPNYKYHIYPLSEYNESLAKLHGVSELAQDGPLSLQGTMDLAKQVLGDWYK